MLSLPPPSFSLLRSFRGLPFLCAMALGGGCIVSVSQAGAPPPQLPFEVGEVIDYDLKWGIFNVGKAQLKVMPMTEFAGETAWHFVFQIRTNAFADRMFKVRTRIDSMVSEDLQRTLHYSENKQEGSTHREIEVGYDWLQRTATYSNFGQAREPVPFGEGPVLDPLGAVYHLRSQVHSKSGEIRFTVMDGRKVAPLRLESGSEERIRVNGKRWRSVVYEPQTADLGGAFAQSANSELRIWFTQDGQVRPLQLQGEVAVGSFWARMVN